MNPRVPLLAAFRWDVALANARRASAVRAAWCDSAVDVWVAAGARDGDSGGSQASVQQAATLPGPSAKLRAWSEAGAASVEKRIAALQSAARDYRMDARRHGVSTARADASWEKVATPIVQDAGVAARVYVEGIDSAWRQGGKVLSRADFAADCRDRAADTLTERRPGYAHGAGAAAASWTVQPGAAPPGDDAEDEGEVLAL